MAVAAILGTGVSPFLGHSAVEPGTSGTLPTPNPEPSGAVTPSFTTPEQELRPSQAVPSGCPNGPGVGHCGSVRQAGGANEGGYPSYQGLYSVARTLSLANNTTYPGRVDLPLPTQPQATAFDPRTNTTYAADLTSGSLSVVNLTRGELVTTIPVGVDPISMAYDPSANAVIVADFVSGFLLVVNATTHNVTEQITGGHFPMAITYVSATNQLFVVNSNYASTPSWGTGNGSLWILNASTLLTVTTLPLGVFPSAETYVPLTESVYVLTSESISVLNVTNDSFSAAIPLSTFSFPPAPFSASPRVRTFPRTTTLPPRSGMLGISTRSVHLL
ncbi:triple helix repeat-containing collagen, partial [mine drainage metagenome]